MALLKSTATVGVATLLSRILGFVRDMVVARIFGASAATDAFFVAFRIPNFMRRLFAEGSFSLAFVPVFAQVRESGDAQALRRLIDRIAGTLIGILLLLTAIGILAAPGLITVFAPGFLDSPDQHALATDMLRITFSYLPLISLTALAAGILNTLGRFAVPALSPVLLNISLIVAAIWLAPVMSQPIVALAWGVLIAGIAQLLFHLPALMRVGLLPRPRWAPRTPEVRRILKLMIPTLIGSSAAQVNLLIDTLIASFLVTGSVTWLYYSDRLLEFPLGVFAIALSTVILPRLARQFSRGDREAFTATLDGALRLATVFALPATVGLILLAGPILSTLFQYQAFSAQDVAMASISLVAYLLGLPAFVLVKILSPAFFSRQDARTPVRFALISMATNTGLNVLFVLGALQLGYAAPHAGLALASALAAWLNAGLLASRLWRQGWLVPAGGWARLAGQVAVSLCLMAVIVWWLSPPTETWSAWGAAERGLRLLWVIGAGGAVYFTVLIALGLRPRHLRY